MRFLKKVLIALLTALSVLSADLPAQQKLPAGNETVILDTSGFWRYHYTLRKPVLKTSGTITDTQLKSFEESFKLETPFLAPGWQAAAFDDSSWDRVCGVPFLGRCDWAIDYSMGVGMFGEYDSSPGLARIYMRGKFEVTEPARVKDLALSVGYLGGAAAYLNGKELARGHLPQGAALTLETLATEYPDEAYLAPDGKPIGKSSPNARIRLRQLSDIKIPSEALCKGVNVLAIEVYRAPYPASVTVAKRGLQWANCGIVSVRLKSQTSEGIIPNATRPKGVQVWNSDPLAYDTDLDFGDPNEPLRPIAIAGTRAGVFSGKVVVGSDQPLKGLRASMGALTRIGGGGEIAPAAARVRYASPNSTQIRTIGHYRAVLTARFDPLEETPPDEAPVRVRAIKSGLLKPGQPKPVFGAVVPVWLTIRVPGDVSAGDYHGTLTVTAEGIKPVLVPVHLTVHAWKMPPPHEFRTFVDLIQSPDSVALYYDTPLWSDRHFQLIEKSFSLMGEVGNKTVYVPLICQTSFGNEQTMVRWVKQPDGKYTYDFSVLDRYLDLYARHCGSPEAVCLDVWDVFLEGGEINVNAHQTDMKFQKSGRGPIVTQLNPATGEVADLQLPLYTKTEESKALWKPLAEQLRLRMKARGWEDRMVLALASDANPSREVVQFFQEILPGARWMVATHDNKVALHGIPYALREVVYALKFTTYPEVKTRLGWKNSKFRYPAKGGEWFSQTTVQFPRNMHEWAPLTTWRLLVEWNIMGSQRGFGRFGADFWPALKNKRGQRVGVVSSRYPDRVWPTLGIEFGTPAVLGAGKDGALSTARLEMIREGVQECEARIFLEEALLDDGRKAKLGEALAGRCRAALNERTLAIERGCGGAQIGCRWYLASGWRQRSGELYALAAEVAAKLDAN